MAEEQQSIPMSPSDRGAALSAVENELPSYRAVSVWAIASLLLGLAGALSFAHWSFLAACVGAIASGAMALRMIGKYPDLLTGKGLANLGIGLGLALGLASFTVGFTRDMILKREIKRFAEEYEGALGKASFAGLMYMQLPAWKRAETTPDKFVEELQKESGGEFEGDPRSQTVKDVMAFLAGPTPGHAHIVRIERVGHDGLTPVGFFVANLESSDPKKEPASQLLGVEVRSEENQGKRGWHVESLVFPYASGAKDSVVESAHGHDH